MSATVILAIVSFFFCQSDMGPGPTVEIAHPHAIFGVEISPDGRLLLLSDRRGVAMFDLAKKSELYRIDGKWSLPGNTSFSPDSKLFAMGGCEGPTLKIWESRTGQEVMTISGDVGYYNYCAFQSDAKQVVFTCRDPATGRRTLQKFSLLERKTVTLCALPERPSGISLREDKLVAVGDVKGGVTFFDITTNNVKTVQTGLDALIDISFLGKRDVAIVSGSSGPGKYRIRRVSLTSDEVSDIELGQLGSSAMAVDERTETVFCVGVDTRKIRATKVGSGVFKLFDLPSEFYPPIRVSPSGEYLVARDVRYRIFVWRLDMDSK